MASRRAGRGRVQPAPLLRTERSTRRARRRRRGRTTDRASRGVLETQERACSRHCVTGLVTRGGSEGIVMKQPARRRIALVLGGGAARGLAHIGVLEVLEREGIPVDYLVGSSMGGLIGALHASGLRAAEIVEVASHFRFPSWFVPGWTLSWERIFRSAATELAGLTFDEALRPMALVAVDVESGKQVVLRSGELLLAVKATCAVPGVLPPVEIGGRWLIDGGLVNLLPVDVAQMFDPGVIVAVKVGAQRSRMMPRLHQGTETLAERLARVAPSPWSARRSFDLLVRGAEIALDRQYTLTAAMVGPDVLVEIDVGTMGLRDFHQLDEAVRAGKRAAEAALARIFDAIESSNESTAPAPPIGDLIFDPMCEMVITAGRARAMLDHKGRTIYFCSANCRDEFARGLHRLDDPSTRR